MSAKLDLERRLADFYATEAPRRAPDRVLESALATIDTTQQRRAHIRVPWRFQTMNSVTKLAVAAVVVIAVGAIGLAVLRPGSSQVGGPPITVSPSPLASPSAGASPSASALPALTETYTSDINGFSTSFPSGWKVIRATQPWTSGLPADCEPPCQDHMYQRETDSPFLSLASQPLGGLSGEKWAAAVLDEPAWEATCPPQTQPITIDGAQGMITVLCPHGMLTAQAWTEDRGYLIVLYRIDDMDWFKEILATVDLDPASAADPAPSASP